MATSTKSRNEAPTQQTSAPPKVESPPTQPSLDDYDYDTLKKELGNKSNVIRFLASKGFKRTEISKKTGLRYQHVRNVLLMPVTKPREPVQ